MEHLEVPSLFFVFFKPLAGMTFNCYWKDSRDLLWVKNDVLLVRICGRNTATNYSL